MKKILLAVLLALCVPAVGWPYPDTSVLDNFNRGDNGSLGANWTESGGNTFINNQCIRSGDGGHCVALWNVSTFGPITEVYCTYANKPGVANAGPGVVFRSSSSANIDNCYILFAINYGYEGSGGCNFRLVKRESGTQTQIGSDYLVSDFGAGHSFGVIADGSSIKVYKNYNLGSGWELVTTFTDSTFSSAGYIGLDLFDNSSISVDDFGGGTGQGAATTPRRVHILRR